MLEVDVREARDADREGLLALHRALHIEHRNEVVPVHLRDLGEYRDFERLLAEDLRAMLSEEGRVVLVATKDGRLVGYATGHVAVEPRRVLGRRGFVGDWYVSPDERGRGLGRRLLDALLERFRAAGCAVVESSTPAGNSRARELHRKLGFDEVEVRYRRRLP